jgi:hypothetical protein
MTKHEAPAESPLHGVAVTGNFTIQATLPQGKQVTFSGYLYEGESIESVNQRVDLLHDAIDRQRTRAEIPELEVILENSIKRLDEIKGHYSVILDKKAKGGKVTTQEKQALDVMDVNVQKHADDITKGREKIAEARAKVGL